MRKVIYWVHTSVDGFISGPNGDSWMGSVRVTVTGDTRFNIEIIRK